MSKKGLFLTKKDLIHSLIDTFYSIFFLLSEWNTSQKRVSSPITDYLLWQKTYEKGIRLSKKEMKRYESRVERSGSLPKWDVNITPLTG